ncbi:MAG: DNA mismatch repair endonuclease MutL [Firmicutes bacterium]|nr:DNA mismatch repair endonuclease MutL [Bacillota bacterium]
MKIRLLPPEIVNRIAAGEVVERPASIVKELMENAIDAGSTQISIIVRAAGRELIQVADNGEGMEAADLELAVQSHATSKITSDSDLEALTTLGFRGEALASIAAVSRLSIITRTAENVTGSQLRVEYGEPGAVKPAGCPSGTTVTVEDLFANTPARNKFLKKDATELALISEAVQQQIIAHPGIRFSLQHNNRQLLSSPGAGKLAEAIASIAGLDTAEACLPCTGCLEGYQVDGYIGSPRLHRSNRQMQFFTVNGRSIVNRLLSAAVEKAFHTLLPVKRHPVVFLNITLPSDQLDVNVHPTKREVKFARPDILFRLLFNSCLEALTPASSSALPGINRRQEYTAPISTPATPSEHISAPIFRHPPEQTAPAPTQLSIEIRETGAATEQTQILGQVFASFLVVATGTELVLIDQHAAQERVMYEHFIAKLASGEKASQVVVPVEAELPAHLYQYVRSHLSDLTALGFRLNLTETGLIVREVPILFKKVLSPEDILTIVETLNSGVETSLQSHNDAALMLMACKAALKANQKLSVHEARALLDELNRCKNNATCPHGRPIKVAFNRMQLEKMFARR